jgi:transcriptional regulator with XRE-family HTH domain
MDVAPLLRTARRRAGLSARSLARKAGTSHATLLAYEAGRVEPSPQVAGRIAAAAGFALEVRLVPEPAGATGTDRGAELVAALELAEALPRRTRPHHLEAPVFPRP